MNDKVKRIVACFLLAAMFVTSTAGMDLAYAGEAEETAVGETQMIDPSAEQDTSQQTSTENAEGEEDQEKVSGTEDAAGETEPSVKELKNGQITSILGKSVANGAIVITEKYSVKPFDLNVIQQEGGGILTYRSSDSKVAEVDQNGKVTLQGIGKVTITVEAAESQEFAKDSAEVKLTVTGTKWLESGGISANLFRINGKYSDLRTAANLPMYSCDVMQGACTDGTYAYCAMIDKTNEKAGRGKIVKLRLSDGRIVKVSGYVKFDHANDMTYNSRAGQLAVVHCTTHKMRISTIDPNTLTIRKSVDVKIPGSLQGATSNQLKSISGISGIAYSAERNQYVVYLSKSHDFLVLNANFAPIRYIDIKSTKYMYQGMDATEDYIMVTQSPNSSSQTYNIISIYTWDGKHHRTVNVKRGHEIESLFHVGSQFYATFYHAYNQTAYKYKTQYVTKKVKWKKVNGKWKYKYKKVKVKWKKVKVKGKWKWKYKYKTKKVKVPYQQHVRAAYVYKLNDL